MAVKIEGLRFWRRLEGREKSRGWIMLESRSYAVMQVDITKMGIWTTDRKREVPKIKLI